MQPQDAPAAGARWDGTGDVQPVHFCLGDKAGKFKHSFHRYLTNTGQRRIACDLLGWHVQLHQ